MFQRWLDRFTEMLRGSSREPDDLALGTSGPAISSSPNRARS
jgi:hypothetical protein